MTPSSSTNRQRGSGMFEAVVAMLLISMLGQGAIYLTSRVTAIQGDTRILEVAVNQMRTSLMNDNDICSSPPVIQLPNSETVTAEVQGCSETITARIDGIDITGIPKPIALSVTSDTLGGQVVVGGTWICLLYTSPSPRDGLLSRMPSSA